MFSREKQLWEIRPRRPIFLLLPPHKTAGRDKSHTLICFTLTNVFSPYNYKNINNIALYRYDCGKKTVNQLVSDYMRKRSNELCNAILIYSILLQKCRSITVI